MNSGSRLILATALPGSAGGLAGAACLAIALAERRRVVRPGAPVTATLLVDGSGAGRRRPTLLASDSARRLEDAVSAVTGVEAAARGSLCFAAADDEGIGSLRSVAEIDEPLDIVALLDPSRWREALDDAGLGPAAVLIRADLHRHASLCALLASELRERRVAHSVLSASPGLVASRRALAGISPGGEAEERQAGSLESSSLARRRSSLPGHATGATGQSGLRGFRSDARRVKRCR